ncbi:hypothetical protein [Streptomyces sp. NPDC085937]|uniref:hypothetical protein n=1 Tax=Streptomyces sp. NPDC085937 TaxID=3365742 RepID=UPI0037D67CBD
MIGFVCVLVAGALTAWVVRGTIRRRDGRAARGEVIEVPCMLRHPARARRWLRGRMAVGPSTLAWTSRTRAGARLDPPTALRQVGTRGPTWREGVLRVNPRAMIVVCESSVGVVEIAVMPHDVGHVLLALERHAAE